MLGLTMTLNIRNISFRGVMENTSHVLVVGEGAERLADKLGVEEVEEDWLITDYARCLKSSTLA